MSENAGSSVKTEESVENSQETEETAGLMETLLAEIGEVRSLLCETKKLQVTRSVKILQFRERIETIIPDENDAIPIAKAILGSWQPILVKAEEDFVRLSEHPIHRANLLEMEMIWTWQFEMVDGKMHIYRNGEIVGRCVIDGPPSADGEITWNWTEKNVDVILSKENIMFRLFIRRDHLYKVDLSKDKGIYLITVYERS